MGNVIDIRAVGPPKQPKRTRTDSDEADPGNAAGMLVYHSRYRKAHRDLSCVRVIAASAIVAGLLLGTAPFALAQVSQLIASVPAAFAQVEPMPVDLSAASVDSPGDGAQPASMVTHRSGTQPALSMISWNGTGQSFKCSFGLLVEGSTRTCEAT